MTPLDWHPIGSAPKDGKKIDVYCIACHGRWCDVLWDEVGEQWVKTSRDHDEFIPLPFEPTHWMRVPPPPTGVHQ